MTLKSFVKSVNVSRGSNQFGWMSGRGRLAKMSSTDPLMSVLIAQPR